MPPAPSRRRTRYDPIRSPALNIAIEPLSIFVYLPRSGKVWLYLGPTRAEPWACCSAKGSALFRASDSGIAPVSAWWRQEDSVEAPHGHWPLPPGSNRDEASQTSLRLRRWPAQPVEPFTAARAGVSAAAGGGAIAAAAIATGAGAVTVGRAEGRCLCAVETARKARAQPANVLCRPAKVSADGCLPVSTSRPIAVHASRSWW